MLLCIRLGVFVCLIFPTRLGMPWGQGAFLCLSFCVWEVFCSETLNQYLATIVQRSYRERQQTQIQIGLKRDFSVVEIALLLTPCKVTSIVSQGDFILMYMKCQMFAVEWRGESFHAHNGILLYISDYSAPCGRAMRCYFPSCQNVPFWW